MGAAGHRARAPLVAGRGVRRGVPPGHGRSPPGLGDDTVILVESDCGLEEPRDKGGVELFTYLCQDEPDLMREWITS